MGDIYGKSVYDELVKNSDLYKGLLEENKRLKEALIDMTQDKAKVISERIILEEENAELKSELSKFSEAYRRYRDYEKEELAESCYDFARENEKLKEDINVLEKAKFEVMAYIDMCHPETYLEAEKLQKIKEMYERIYNEKLYFLEKENNELKEEIGKLVMKQ